MNVLLDRSLATPFTAVDPNSAGGEPGAPPVPPLIHLRHLRQHRTSLRANRDVFICLRQPGQHRPHIAVRLHRLHQSQGLHPNTGVRVADQRPQNSIPYSRILSHKAAQPIQRLQTHSRIGIVLQCIHQRFSHPAIVGRLGQQIHRVHPHPRVVVVARGKQQQLLDALVIQRALRFLGQDRVVLDAHLIRSRLLRPRPDAGNRGSCQGLIKRRIAARSNGARHSAIPTTSGKEVVSRANTSAKYHDENDGSQGRRQPNLPQPSSRLNNHTLPESSRLRRFQRFLQPHPRCRQQVRSRLRHRHSRKRRVELARRFQLGGAFRTPRQVLLYLEAGVVLQFVVHIEQNVLPHPITFHFRIPSQRQRLRLSPKSKLIASPPARCAIFASRGTMYSLPSLPSYSASRPPYVISARDSASTRTPSAREASGPPKPRRSSVPVPAASNRVPDWLRSARRGTALTGCTLRPRSPPRPEAPPCEPSVSADDRGRDW